MNLSTIIIHENYGGKMKSFANDIALLELAWKMSFDTEGFFMWPACLPMKDEQKNLNMTGKFLNVAGYGEIIFFINFKTLDNSQG